MDWTAVSVCLGSVRVIGYELRTVDAGSTDVSTRVNVSCGSVDTMVLYWVDTIVPAGSDVVTEITCVSVLAGRTDVSVNINVLAGWIYV